MVILITRQILPVCCPVAQAKIWMEEALPLFWICCWVWWNVLVYLCPHQRRSCRSNYMLICKRLLLLSHWKRPGVIFTIKILILLQSICFVLPRSDRDMDQKLQVEWEWEFDYIFYKCSCILLVSWTGHRIVNADK